MKKKFVRKLKIQKKNFEKIMKLMVKHLMEDFKDVFRKRVSETIQDGNQEANIFM